MVEERIISQFKSNTALPLKFNGILRPLSNEVSIKKELLNESNHTTNNDHNLQISSIVNIKNSNESIFVPLNMPEKEIDKSNIKFDSQILSNPIKQSYSNRYLSNVSFPSMSIENPITEYCEKTDHSSPSAKWSATPYMNNGPHTSNEYIGVVGDSFPHYKNGYMLNRWSSQIPHPVPSTTTGLPASFSTCNSVTFQDSNDHMKPISPQTSLLSNGVNCLPVSNYFPTPTISKSSSIMPSISSALYQGSNFSEWNVWDKNTYY